MESCWPEKPVSTKRERAIEKLERGQESATQLQFLLREPYGDQIQGCLLADELLGQISRSFTETLSVLGIPAVPAGEDCQNVAVVGSQVMDSGCCDDRSSEDSGESRKTPVAKDRRGCYKRKRTSESWTTVSATVEDGHAWRKYGQKEILNSKFPRSYYRCSRKYDQGCKATKQVQKVEIDPQIVMYRTTYLGHHTCRDILNSPPIISDAAAAATTPHPTWESCYEAPIIISGQDHDLQSLAPFSNITSPPSPTTPLTTTTTTTTTNNNNNAKGLIIKEECKESEGPSDDRTVDTASSLDQSDHNLWKDLVPFGSADDGEPKCQPPPAYSSVSSEAISRQSLDMFDFDPGFHLELMQASFFLAS